MALIKCPECGKDISDRAEICVNCGFPISKIINENISPEVASAEDDNSEAILQQKGIETEKEEFPPEEQYISDEEVQPEAMEETSTPTVPTKRKKSTWIISMVATLAVALIIFFITASPYEYELLSNGTISITKYKGSNEEVVIPAELNGKTVTVIGEKAFEKNSKIKKVTIPNGVTVIGASAFSYCENLVSVQIPDSVTELGNYSFMCCFKLVDIKLPDKLIKLGKSAIRETAITELVFPSGVKDTGEWAFADCNKLTSITFPSTLHILGENAFSGCDGLEEITIPASIDKIGEGAFTGCQNLKRVYIASALTIVGDGAFFSCPKLTLEIPNTYQWKNLCEIYKINYVIQK